MPKFKKNSLYTIAHLLISHPWLKLIALILAVMVWFYITGEIKRFNLPAKELWQGK